MITYCSRLDLNKTIAAEKFIFAFFKLAANHNNLNAIVIGGGNGKSRIQKEAEILNECLEREAIHTVGVKQNVNDYYLSSDIVVGTGRVALEAMSFGKPVIAAGSNGYVGIIENRIKEIQWQFYFGDHGSVKDLDLISIYKDMKYLFFYENARIKIGNWCNTWCKEMFNISKVTSDTLLIYKMALKKKYSLMKNML